MGHSCFERTLINNNNINDNNINNNNINNINIIVIITVAGSNGQFQYTIG